MPTRKTTSQSRWVEGAVVYQIYPRSFYDSNADGIGDIPGIIKKLDYLKDLGVTAMWLSPFYPSPMADFGYDVADYCDVDPIFGKLADMKRLLKAAHARNIKLIVDLVPNHSSDEHEWFRQSRQSREGDYADWYIWKDPKGFDEDGQPIPPSNWIEVLTGGTAWEWEPARQQFYLHSFDVRQPDLNWENPKVREAIKDVMRFWLDLGVDGFRVDAVHFMAKDPDFRDEPDNPGYQESWGRYARLQHPYNHAWPAVYDYLNDMAQVLKEPAYRAEPRFMITEAYPDTEESVEDYMLFYKGVDPGVSAPFNFEGISLPWEAASWQTFLSTFHKTLDDLNPLCVASYAFGNHDQPRIVSRLGEAARASAVMLLTLPGMAFIYNGEEIGMANGDIPLEYIQDPGAQGGSGRDPERTPMQWSAAKNAGFSEADTTWLPVADGYETCNVEAEADQPDSFLSLYKNLIALRHKASAIKLGTINVLDQQADEVLAYERNQSDETYLVVINFSGKPASYNCESAGKLVISSRQATKLSSVSAGMLKLAANEAVIIRVDA